MIARPTQFGFSLVELSIVLVILGLLTGGILGGQALIRAAELRAVSTEYSRWVTATRAFQDKYFALPGDMTNATQFWGSAAGNASDNFTTSCYTGTGSGTQTCNGGGDGRVFTPALAANQYGERFMFWQHLANAGLIEGSYTGRAGTATEHYTTSNTARGRISNSLWMMASDHSGGTAMFPVAVARHNFRIGGATSNSWPVNRIFRPEEVWNLDQKMDDARPGTGSITAPISTYDAISPNCVSTAVASTAEYVLNHSGLSCIMFFASGI